MQAISHRWRRLSYQQPTFTLLLALALAFAPAFCYWSSSSSLTFPCPFPYYCCCSCPCHCPCYGLRTQELRVSPIQFDSKGTEQNNTRSVGNVVGSARLASPVVVAFSTPTTDTVTNPRTSFTTPANRPSGTSGNPSNVPSATLGRIPYLLQRYQAEALPNYSSQPLAPLHIKPSCKRWSSWWCARQINPISASLKDLFPFLAEC